MVYFLEAEGSNGSVMVKLLACEAGSVFDSRSHRNDYRELLSLASKSRYGWNIAKAT